MYCSKCGHEIKNSSVFCEYCGSKISSDLAEEKDSSKLSKKHKQKRFTIVALVIVLLICSISLFILVLTKNLKHLSAESTQTVTEVKTESKPDSDMVNELKDNKEGSNDLFSAIDYSVPPGKIWDKTFGTNGDEICTSLIQTQDGGYIISGSSHYVPTNDNTVSTNQSVPNNNVSKNKDLGDFWVIKLDANGEKKWDKNIGTANRDSCTQMIQTQDGGYLLGGYTDLIEDGGGNLSDLLIIKLNAEGEKEWDKTFGTSSFDFLGSLIETQDGGYLLGGVTNGSDGDNTDGNNGGDDCWIIKINANGEKEWDKTYGTSGDEKNIILSQAQGGGFLLTTSVCKKDGNNSSEINGDCYDLWVVKISYDGEKEWDKIFGTENDDECHCLTRTQEGGYLLGGRSGINLSGECWIIKLDSDGNKEWDKTFGTAGGCYATCTCLIQTPEDGYLLGGFVDGIDGDNTDGNNGFSDYWIIKINSNGEKQWDKTYGSSEADSCLSIIQAEDGGYLLGGVTGGDDGDITNGNNGGNDYWVIKLGYKASMEEPEDITNSEENEKIIEISEKPNGNDLINDATKAITFALEGDYLSANKCTIAGETSAMDERSWAFMLDLYFDGFDSKAVKQCFLKDSARFDTTYDSGTITFISSEDEMVDLKFKKQNGEWKLWIIDIYSFEY